MAGREEKIHDIIEGMQYAIHCFHDQSYNLTSTNCVPGIAASPSSLTVTTSQAGVTTFILAAWSG